MRNPPGKLQSAYSKDKIAKFCPDWIFKSKAFGETESDRVLWKLSNFQLKDKFEKFVLFGNPIGFTIEKQSC